ncbi:hypothetical protein V6N13_145411 [Hibiscus sabdariffa]|uniref:Uncharacterized protein n=1 Tax=Hibiscus sabdariffa TaxID=183260 RepID=A0ABR2TPI0_9ROSI
MKNKPSVLLKQMLSSVLANSIAKAKSMAAKGKLNAAKARLIISTLLKSKKAVFLGSISTNIHGLLGDEQEQEQEQDDQSKAIVPYSFDFASNYGDVDDENKYPDLTHSLFDEESELEAATRGGSIVEMVRNSKEEGEDFHLEDEIDHVADLFITRFYKQMRLQKLLSFKRHQEMMERSV